MNNDQKLVLKPGHTFLPSDFMTVPGDGGGMRLRQASLDLATKETASSAPWDVAEGADKPGYNFRMTRRLHAQMLWVTENVPKHKSLQLLIEKAVTGYVEAQIRQHYKPETE
ncbi:MAG: hypothetical protein WKG03_00040 [Telluria sp.]